MALPGYDSHTDVTYQGSVWLWTVFAVMAVAALSIWGLSFLRAPKHREFYYVSMIINGVAALAYLCMALGVGSAHIGERTFLVQRYFDWIVTTPLLLIDLCLLAGRSLTSIFGIVALDELMIISGLLAEMTDKPGASWTLFAFAMVCYFPIIWYLVEDYHLDYTAPTFGQTTANRYFLFVGWLVVVWAFYPLAWILHRANVIGVDGAIFWYGVLDILAKPVFSALILASNPLRNADANLTKAGPGSYAGTGRTTGHGDTISSERDVELANQGRAGGYGRGDEVKH